jgi:type IV secretory pathway VirB2 component (pilin)
MTQSIFAGLDLWVIAYAASMALVASLLTTVRAREAQRRQGLPLSSWLTTIPDTATGAVVGTLLAVIVPRVWAPANNFTGVSLLAALGGIAGPRLWDFASSERGFRSMLYALGNTAAPLLGKFLAAQPKEGDTDGRNPPPPSAP